MSKYINTEVDYDGLAAIINMDEHIEFKNMLKYWTPTVHAAICKMPEMDEIAGVIFYSTNRIYHVHTRPGFEHYGIATDLIEFVKDITKPKRDCGSYEDSIVFNVHRRDKKMISILHGCEFYQSLSLRFTGQTGNFIPFVFDPSVDTSDDEFVHLPQIKNAMKAIFNKEQ